MEKSLSKPKAKRIVLLGPESSGKTWFAKTLAERLGYDYIPEYARNYLENKLGAYHLEDLVHIAKEQFRASHEIGVPCVCDTETLTILIWAKRKFGRVPGKVFTLLEQQQFDLYLLVKPDIPWEEDPLREDPYSRQEIYLDYHTELKNRGVRFVEIGGSFSERAEWIECIYSRHR